MLALKLGSRSVGRIFVGKEHRLKVALNVSWALAAALLLGAASAQAGPVDKLVCKRLSGGPVSSFVMTLDIAAKQIDVPSSTGFQPDPDSVEFTATSVHWSFMRGFVEFDRRTGALDWDTTSEYAYLEAIGQPSDQPESNFLGKMLCKVDGGSPSP